MTWGNWASEPSRVAVVDLRRAVVAVEFLTDEQAARYGSFHEAPSRAELERYFFLDDADREAVQAKRRAHNRLGFAVQLTSVRFLGRFMPGPAAGAGGGGRVPGRAVGDRGRLVSEAVRRAGRYGP
ncbi:hypothetical protein SCOCK_210060 [Actinacidiphila cocklensis]|uniref:DUF4158 domain-containing protein n=1 Tax=Actinacidiphila cocklensis TaxID=887465 RepID=A0A9W4DLI3_9ACTN|nr:hypothetical protein SCOCK_210060 [Actinacidiphila cocklensis]